MIPDYRRFKVVISVNQAEREALRKLAEHERLSKSATVRRLIWKAAKEVSVQSGEAIHAA